MKKLALLFSIIALASGICRAQTTGFTYQGKLGTGGAPANGAATTCSSLCGTQQAGARSSRNQRR